MKEKLFNDYSITINQIEQVDDYVYKFNYNNAEYYYIKKYISETEIKRKAGLSNFVKNELNIKLDELIINKSNTFLSNDGYVLLKKVPNDTNAELDDLLKFSIKKYYLNNCNINWSIEWQKIIDDLELVIDNKRISDIDVLTTVNFFIGMGENAICLYNKLKINNYYVIAHNQNTFSKIDIYNPLIIDWNYEQHDIANYIRLTIINDTFSMEDINYILAIKKWGNEDTLLMFSRLLFCNEFFVELSKYCDGKENSIKKYLQIANNYLYHIKEIKQFLINYGVNIPVFWLSL